MARMLGYNDKKEKEATKTARHKQCALEKGNEAVAHICIVVR